MHMSAGLIVSLILYLSLNFFSGGSESISTVSPSEDNHVSVEKSQDILQGIGVEDGFTEEVEDENIMQGGFGG